MGWRFWRRDEPPSRALPADTGLQWQPGVGPVRGGSRPDPDDDPLSASAFSGASPRPGATVVDDAGTGDLTAAEHRVDEPFARRTADAVVDLVTAVVSGDGPGVAAARSALTALLGPATDDQQGLAVIVALVPLSTRLPELAGVTEALPDDPLAREELLAYAPLLAGRADPLRARWAPELSPEQLRFSALFACGAPDADPALEGLFTSPTVDQVTASCLLLAQTCADGAAGPGELRAEISATFPPAAPA